MKRLRTFHPAAAIIALLAGSSIAAAQAPAPPPAPAATTAPDAVPALPPLPNGAVVYGQGVDANGQTEQVGTVQQGQGPRVLVKLNPVSPDSSTPTISLPRALFSQDAGKVSIATSAMQLHAFATQ